MQARPGTPVSTTLHATARHAWRCNCKSDLPTRAPAPAPFACSSPGLSHRSHPAHVTAIQRPR
eukprot:2093942-Rhodomonas_salina.1